MPRLKSRDMQIPNGFQFFQPQTKWRPARMSSFETIVHQLIQHRHGNPRLAAKYNWSTDPTTVANEVDEFNAQLCKQMGWTKYIDEGVQSAPPTSFPVPPSSPLQKLGAVVGGAKTLVKWIASGAEAVPAALAEKRASICVDCPKHDKGDWTRRFTVPTANAIRDMLIARKGMNLSTSFDDRLQVCTACDCPLKLKVHIERGRIVREMGPETLAKLDPGCWIPKEGG